MTNRKEKVVRRIACVLGGLSTSKESASEPGLALGWCRQHESDVTEGKSVTKLGSEPRNRRLSRAVTGGDELQAVLLESLDGTVQLKLRREPEVGTAKNSMNTLLSRFGNGMVENIDQS